MLDWFECLRRNSKSYVRPEIKLRDFIVFIASYGRPELLKEYTLKTFEELFKRVPYKIMVSDDDKQLNKYLEMYGDKVYVFNKEEAQKKFNADTCDALDIKGVIFFERNIEFIAAKELGYRYFMHLEDDYLKMSYKMVGAGDSSPSISMDMKYIPEVCELYFRVLDSSPYIHGVCMAQGGDYVGGSHSHLNVLGCKNKGMNIYCLDTQKEFKLTGRINEDASAYYVNGKCGMLFFTLPMLMLTQLPTQNSKGGVSDIYKRFGTYLKTIYTVVQRPDAVKISVFETASNTSTKNEANKRIHHRADNKKCFVKTISPKYCKTIVPHTDVMRLDIEPDFKSQPYFFDLPEPNILDAYIDSNLFDEW